MLLISYVLHGFSMLLLELATNNICPVLTNSSALACINFFPLNSVYQFPYNKGTLCPKVFRETHGLL